MKFLKLTIFSFLFISLLGFGCNSKPAEPILGASELAIKDKLDKSTLKDKYQVIGTSLKMDKIKNADLDKYTGEPKDEIKVTLGSNTSTGFEPTIEMKRWNEVKFKLKPNLDSVEAKDKKFDIVGDKIKFDTPKISFEMYEAEDAYKYVWYLNEKPTTNTVSFQIESEGLNFFYQPPLNEESYPEADSCTETQCFKDGQVIIERPIDIVNSYAVYHQTKGGMVDAYGKDYKVGKAFHIYRPHIIDALGNETWGKLHIENGIYTVEIPQAFLDTATYPIKSNDTFGNGAAGASNAANNEDILGIKATAPANMGTVTSLSAFMNNASGVTRNIKGIVVVSTTKAITTNGVGGAIALVNVAGPAEWATSTYSSAPTVSAGTVYILAAICDAGALCSSRYDTGAAGIGLVDTTNSFTTPTNPTDGVNNARNYSVYATYTPAGAGSSTYSPIYLKTNTNLKTNTTLK